MLAIAGCVLVTHRNSCDAIRKIILTYALVKLRPLSSGCLAQLGERWPYKPQVAGSTPATPTMQNHCDFGSDLSFRSGSSAG